VTYELREYEVDPDALDAETVAAKIGLPAEQVFKTLVARGDRTGICLAVVPANAELDERPWLASPAIGRPNCLRLRLPGGSTWCRGTNRTE